jgi:hypothetical protein
MGGTRFAKVSAPQVAWNSSYFTGRNAFVFQGFYTKMKIP